MGNLGARGGGLHLLNVSDDIIVERTVIFNSPLSVLLLLAVFCDDRGNCGTGDGSGGTRGDGVRNMGGCGNAEAE